MHFEYGEEVEVIPRGSIADDPYAAFAKLAAQFETRRVAEPGVHASAVVAGDALIDPSAQVGPFVAIGARSRIEAGAIIGRAASSARTALSTKPANWSHGSRWSSACASASACWCIRARCSAPMASAWRWTQAAG